MAEIPHHTPTVGPRSCRPCDSMVKEGAKRVFRFARDRAGQVVSLRRCMSALERAASPRSRGMLHRPTELVPMATAACGQLLDLLDDLTGRHSGEGPQAVSKAGSSKDRPLRVTRRGTWDYPASTPTPIQVRWLQAMGFSQIPGKTPDSIGFKHEMLEPCAVQALAFARSVVEVLLDFDQERLSECLFANDMSSYASFFARVASWPLEDFVKNAKFFTIFPMARYLRNDPPKSPPSSYGYTGSVGSALLFGGAVRQYLKNRLIGGRPRDAALFNSLLQGVKRGCAVVPEGYIIQSFESHREALTKRTSLAAATALLASEKFDKVWAGSRLGTNRLPQPSTSASYNKARSEGGSWMDVLEQFQRAGTANPKGKLSVSTMGLSRPEIQIMSEVRPGVVKTQYGPVVPRTFDQLEPYLVDRPCLQVMVHAVLEPLKVRLITKGEALYMYYARRAQRSMWQHLRTYPQFALIGEPLTVDHIRSLRRRTVLLDLPFDQWVSGDYSAATDNLKIDATKLSFETFLNSVGATFRQRKYWRLVLYEQGLNYPVWSELTAAMQTTGQLMGSVLSFPILCSCNLVAYWMALERYLGREVGLRDLPVLINGDDILFMSNEDFYEVWKETVEQFGFILSPGKNYIHPHLICINSTCFWAAGGRYTPIPFLNVGLLNGQSKVASRTQERVLPLWAVYNRMMAGASNPLRAHKRFLKLHKAELSLLTHDGEFNLFIDPHYGGLGFELFDEVRPHVCFTHFQRKFANYMRLRLQNIESEQSALQTLMGVVAKHADEEVVPEEVRKYHWGHFSLRSYTKQHSEESTWFTLVLGEDERLPLDRAVKVPLLGRYPGGDLVFRIKHPRPRELRGYRQYKRFLAESLKRVITQDLTYVEFLPSESLAE